MLCLEVSYLAKILGKNTLAQTVRNKQHLIS